MTAVLYAFSDIERARGWFKQLVDGIIDTSSCTADYHNLKVTLPDSTFIFVRELRSIGDLVELTGMRFGVIIEEQQFVNFDGWYTWRQIQRARFTTYEQLLRASPSSQHQAIVRGLDDNKRQAIERLVRRLKRVAALKAARAKPKWDLKW